MAMVSGAALNLGGSTVHDVLVRVHTGVCFFTIDSESSSSSEIMAWL